MAFLESRRDGTLLELTLRGEWRAAAIAPIRKEVAALDLEGVQEARVAAAGAERLDLAGAWVLDDLTRILAGHGVAVQFADGEPSALQLVRSALHDDPEAKPAAMRGEVNFSIVERLGRTTVERVEGVRDGL
ncbi:MAG TPA: hypothetical protein VMK82_05785, partial [Steroidobacteraceae bacterium]|nr:hypothetical protein [Steroidobacteraceae bacterium]